MLIGNELLEMLFMTQVKALSQEIREKLPRVILDFVTIIITLMVAYVVLPIAYSISFNIPAVGISIGLMVAIIFLVILAIIVVRILRDVTVILHVSSDELSKAVPGLEEPHQSLIRKTVRDLSYVIVVIILFYVVTPLIVLIPGVGASLAAAIPLILAAIVVILLYDVGRLIYDEIAKSVHKVTEKLASAVEEYEKSK
jgi:hypothetical protein